MAMAEEGGGEGQSSSPPIPLPLEMEPWLLLALLPVLGSVQAEAGDLTLVELDAYQTEASLRTHTNSSSSSNSSMYNCNGSSYPFIEGLDESCSEAGSYLAFVCHRDDAGAEANETAARSSSPLLRRSVEELEEVGVCSVCRSLLPFCQRLNDLSNSRKPLVGLHWAWKSCERIGEKYPEHAASEKEGPCLDGLPNVTSTAALSKANSEEEAEGSESAEDDGDLLSLLSRKAAESKLLCGHQRQILSIADFLRRAWSRMAKNKRVLLICWPLVFAVILGIDVVTLVVFGRISRHLGFNPYLDHISIIVCDLLMINVGTLRLFTSLFGVFPQYDACTSWLAGGEHWMNALIVSLVTANHCLILLFTNDGVRTLRFPEAYAESLPKVRALLINVAAYAVSLTTGLVLLHPFTRFEDGACAYFLHRPSGPSVPELFFTRRSYLAAAETHFCLFEPDPRKEKIFNVCQVVVTALLVVSCGRLLKVYLEKREEDAKEAAGGANEEMRSFLSATAAIIAEAFLAIAQTSIIVAVFRFPEYGWLETVAYAVSSVQILSHFVFFVLLSPQFRQELRVLCRCAPSPAVSPWNQYVQD